MVILLIYCSVYFILFKAMYILEGRLCMGIVRFTGNEAVYSDKRSF